MRRNIGKITIVCSPRIDIYVSGYCLELIADSVFEGDEEISIILSGSSLFYAFS